MHEPSRNTRGRRAAGIGLVLIVAILAAWTGLRLARPRVEAAFWTAARHQTGVEIAVEGWELQPPRTAVLHGVRLRDCHGPVCAQAQLSRIEVRIDPVALWDHALVIQQVVASQGVVTLLAAPPRTPTVNGPASGEPAAQAARPTGAPAPVPDDTRAAATPADWALDLASLRVVLHDVDWVIDEGLPWPVVAELAEGHLHELALSRVPPASERAEARFVAHADADLPAWGRLTLEAETAPAGLGSVRILARRGDDVEVSIRARGADIDRRRATVFGLEARLQGPALAGARLDLTATAPEALFACTDAGCEASAGRVTAQWLPDGSALEFADVRLARSAAQSVAEFSRAVADNEWLGVRALQEAAGRSLRIESSGFPLSRLAAALPATLRPPVDSGTLAGAVDLRWTPSGWRAELDASIEGAGFQWTRIAADRIDGVRLLARGAVSAAGPAWRADLDTVGIGTALAEITASGTGVGPGARLELEVTMPPIDAAGLAASMPAGLTPWLTEAAITGRVGFGAWFSIQADRPDLSLGQVELYSDAFSLETRGAKAAPTVSAGHVAALPGSADRGWPQPGTPRWVPLSALPPWVVRSVLAAEDDGFYQHGGVDWRGIQRAMAANLRAGSFVAGGSTISQQVAKNLYLSGERSLSRKAQELVLTFLLESHLTKDQILEIYLNTAQFGPGIVGVEAAAGAYFSKRATALTRGESLVLGTILPNPGRFGRQYARGALEASRLEKMRHIVDNLERARAIPLRELRELRHRIDQNRLSDAPLPVKLFDATPSQTQP